MANKNRTKENLTMQPYNGSSSHLPSISQSISNYMVMVSNCLDPIPREEDLMPLFLGLKVEYRTSQVFEEAKNTLITLFQMTSSGPPQELIDLADTHPPVASVTCIPTPLDLRTIEVDLKSPELSPTQIKSYFDSITPPMPIALRQKKPKSPCDESIFSDVCKIETTGLFHSTPSKPALTQFFESVDKLEAEIKGSSQESPLIYLGILDRLTSNFLVETALAQIPHDQLELRRLCLLRYSLEKLNDLYLFIIKKTPQNLRNLATLTDLRMKDVFNPSIFPEKIIIYNHARVPVNPLNREIINYIASKLAEFRDSLIYHNESEATILIQMIESLSFQLIQKLHMKHFGSWLPYSSFEAFKATCESKNTTDVIYALMEELIKTPMQASSSTSGKTVAAISPTPEEITAPPSIEIAPAKKNSSRPPRFPKENTKDLPDHFSFFAAGLKAMDEGDLLKALEQSNNIIKFYERILEIHGGIPQSYKCSEALADFFCLVSDQLEILQRDNPSEKELYDANLVRLHECKAAAKAYFIEYNPIEHISRNLIAFLEGLEKLHAPTLLGNVSSSKKQKTLE